MTDWFLRLRAIVDEQFAVVIAILVVLVLLSGWLTYATHVDPGTTTEERPGAWQSTTGWFNHSATVTENNSVYPVGTTLTDRPIYFTEIAPRFNGTYTFAYDASEGGDVNGTVSLQFVLRGIEENRRNSTVVWQTTRPLRTTSKESLEPGETIRVPFSVNMNRTVNRTERIDEQLDNPPGQPQAVVRATVNMQGTVNGQSVDRVREYTLPVAVERGTYRPADPGKMTERQEATRTVTVGRTYGPLRTMGAPVLFFSSSVAFIGLLVAGATGRIGLSPAEQELLTYEDDREDFDEWISTIRLPDEAFDLPRAEATSLGSLVDFAIDTDNSVVEDPVDDAYYVLHDGYLYTYRPPLHRDDGRLDVQTDSDRGEPEPIDRDSAEQGSAESKSDPAGESSEAPADAPVEE